MPRFGCTSVKTFKPRKGGVYQLSCWPWVISWIEAISKRAEFNYEKSVSAISHPPIKSLMVLSSLGLTPHFCWSWAQHENRTRKDLISFFTILLETNPIGNCLLIVQQNSPCFLGLCFVPIKRKRNFI